MEQHVTEEQLRVALEGYKQLRDNPWYQSVQDQIRREYDASRNVIEAGEFPSDGMSGILLREQLIGEIRGLKRSNNFLESVIIGLQDKLDEFVKKPEPNKETNDTV